MNLMNQQQAPEEESDYDVFADVRPKNSSVQNKNTPIEDVDENEDDFDDFADVRPQEDKINEVKKKKSEPKKQYTPGETVKDVAKQAVKGVLIGASGTWGDLTELVGLNRENPTDKAKNSRDFDTLDKINDSGKQRSFWETYAQVNDLTDDSPTQLRLPTSKNLESLNDAVGGPGEAETPSGKFANRAGKLYGAGLAFGQVNPTGAVVAGGAGQITEELGGGPLLQTASEIAALLLAPGQAGKRLAASAEKEVQQLVNGLRAAGYSEEDITLAINRFSGGKKGGIRASKSEATEQAFENFANRSEKLVSDILTSEIPGIEQGTQRVHQMASDAYGQVAREASGIIIKDSTPFINSATGVVRELRRNLGTTPEAEGFLNRLHDAVVASTQRPTAESFMNFYKELNSAGKWIGRSQRDRLISQVKDGIKDTFRNEGRQGRQLAEKFEEANRGIQRAYRAEEVHDLLQKTLTQDGYNFKQMHKIFDKPENHQLFEQVLGARQTQNLNLIAKTGKEVANFDKAWKSTSLLKGNIVADSLRGAGIGYYVYKGDMEGLSVVLATKVGGVAAKKIAEKCLTSPRMQNIIIKGLHSLKAESPKALKSANEAMQKFFDEEGIDAKVY